MMTRILVSALFLVCFNAHAEVPKVVVTIQPLNALVAGVMKGVGVPKLLLDPHESAHHFSLTPTEAQAISEANLFVWIGPRMETVLENSVKTLATKGRILTVMDIHEVILLDLENGQKDPHLWLDPNNAKIIVRNVSEMLSGMDPDHAGVYAENAANILAQLDKLNDKLLVDLTPIKNKPYLVYHDAFQYFEKAFGLTRSIPLVKDTEHTIRASQRSLIETKVQEHKITCVFGEPNHGEKMVESLAEQLGLHIAFLDPIASQDESSPERPYFDMMEQLASSLIACLGKDDKK